MGRLFGTDGVRGTANIHPMTVEMAMKLGRAAGHIFREGGARHRIVIGKDTRVSGYMLESALTSGICSMGVDVLLVGPLPTPGIAFITRSLRADAGVVLSASHNPFEDNGIKFFSRDGMKLPDNVEDEIEDLITSGKIDHVRPTADAVGKASRIDDAVGRYVEFTKSSFPKGLMLEGMKIVLDCANGAAYKVAPTVLKELGAKVFVINDKPNGVNINAGCGSLHPEVIQNAVVEQGADIGIAHDGDADRVIFCDEKGREFDGDKVMALCAVDMKERGALAGDTLVATVMSNIGLEIAMREAGIRLVRAAVGDRYVMEEMRSGGFNLGGEQSGHVIFLDHNTTGDGVVTALQVLSIMKRSGKRLSELGRVMNTYPQVLVNVRVREKVDLAEVPALTRKIAEAESMLDGNGRLLIRYSGTEPKLRIMAEGKDHAAIERIVRDLAAAVEKELGGD
ncbi:MAG: phosphoglucosamine mutase [Nitrospirae bacterium]|nr:phosphoglucosamine mutase [Nitrospirota bacterium]MBI5695912.1 phosphoglucosamine mutase [Nitrospirota bacterium]